MKLKIGAFLIVLSTAAVIGTMSIVLDKTSRIQQPATTQAEPVRFDNKKPLDMKRAKPVTGMVETKNTAVLSSNEHDEPDLDGDSDDEIVDNEEQMFAHAEELSNDDIQKINGIVSLSEADLARELNALKDRIEDEDLFGKLEEGELTGDKELEAKETLERFALLGLEGTRRKYMAMDPELRDPINAYKDSLMEIREMLNDEGY